MVSMMICRGVEIFGDLSLSHDDMFRTVTKR